MSSSFFSSSYPILYSQSQEKEKEEKDTAERDENFGPATAASAVGRFVFVIARRLFSMDSRQHTKQKLSALLCSIDSSCD